MINFNKDIDSRVVAINISKGGIPKWPVESVHITFAGLKGDGHNHSKHYRPEQAVSLQDIEKLAELRHEGYALSCGMTGENINVGGMDVNGLPLGTVLRFSRGVELEISKVRHPCYVLDSIHPQLKEVIVGRCGMYARVIKEGILRVGEAVYVYKPMDKILV